MKYVPEKDFRELFTVTVDPIRCTDTCIGITNDGTLLYIEEQMMSSGNAYWMDREFFEIDKEEFCRYLAVAEENGEIAKAVRSGRITEEELEQLEDLESPQGESPCQE